MYDFYISADTCVFIVHRMVDDLIFDELQGSHTLVLRLGLQLRSPPVFLNSVLDRSTVDDYHPKPSTCERKLGVQTHLSSCACRSR